MIRVLRSDPAGAEVEALIRSVGTDLEACTPFGRTVEVGAGEEVLRRLHGSGEVPIGAAFVTPGGDLPVSLLIHVVIRSTEQPISESSVRNALRNGLRQAAQWEIGALAVPPLGVGAGNLDAEASARIMCPVLGEHMAASPFPGEVVVIVGNAYEEEAFRRELERMRRGTGPALIRPDFEEWE